jgi:hypothetical protein
VNDRSEAYTSCTVVLHSAVQKQLYGFPRSYCDDDLVQAKQCLEVLEYCGSEDHVARGFHERLSAAYEVIVGENANHGSILEQVREAISPTGPDSTATLDYIFTSPRTNQPSHMEASQRLLTMLCTPFADDPLKPDAEEIMDNNERIKPRCFEYSWDFERNQSFHWDIDEFGSGSESIFVNNDLQETPTPRHLFFGSRTPSGWLPAGNILRLH